MILQFLLQKILNDMLARFVLNDLQGTRFGIRNI